MDDRGNPGQTPQVAFVHGAAYAAMADLAGGARRYRTGLGTSHVRGRHGLDPLFDQISGRFIQISIDVG